MTTLPRGNTPGIYTVCTAANTKYAIPIPDSATACIIAFVRSASDDTLVWGRVRIAETDGALTPDNTNMGHHPPMPIEFDSDDGTGSTVNKVWTLTKKDKFIQIAAGTAGVVCKGMWFSN